MVTGSRGIVVTSMGFAGLMLLLSVSDLATGVPFGGQTVFDVMMIISAGIVEYMGINCLKDFR